MALVTILDRSVARQVLVPSALGFVTYTFLLMMRGIFALIEQILVRGLPLVDALSILAATVPHVVVLTIPMGFLFGVLIAIGRMSADNEIIALQAGGVPVRRLLRPVLLVGVTLTLINGYIFMEVIPGANRNLKGLRIKVFTASKHIGRIEPKVFHEEFPNLLVYVDDVDLETGAWTKVLAYDSSSPGEERLTLAQRGRVVTAPRDKAATTEVLADGRGGASREDDTEPWLLLENAVTHHFFRVKPDTYRVNNSQILLFRPHPSGQGIVRYDLAMRERDTGDLVRLLRGDDLPQTTSVTGEEREQQLRLAGIELHRRLAVPAASTVFALLALPLGVGSRSGGRGRGFVLSIAVVLVYYVMSNNGELLALEGKIPIWLGIWLPNLSLTLLSLFLLQRMGRWLGERQSGEGFVGFTLRQWYQSRKTKTVDRAAPGHPRPITGSIPAALQRRRYSFGFPTLLDRYITRRLLSPLLFVLLSTAMLYVVIDLTDHIDEMAENHAPLDVILSYYWNLIPQVFLDVIPFGLLISVLVVLTLLERQQELTALKGAGVSLYRLVLPILLLATVGAASMWVLGESVVPVANRELDRLRDRINGRDTTRSYRLTDRQWMLSRDDSSFYNFLRYDADEQTLIRFTMYGIDEELRLRFRLFAHRARYRNGAWIADGGWFRQFFPDGTDKFQRISSPMELGVPEGPEYFGQEYSSPSEMSARELAEYIAELKDSGYLPHRLVVRWHQKIAYPLSALVMVCLALPYGLGRGGRRVSTLQGVAVALGLGIGYFLLVAVFGKLGETAILPPEVGAWAPVVFAVLFAVNRMTTLRT